MSGKRLISITYKKFITPNNEKTIFFQKIMNLLIGDLNRHFFKGIKG